MSSILHLPTGERDRIRAWAEAGYPEECCGLLVGRQEQGQARVAYATSARNLNRERARDRYELSGEDFLVTDREAAAAGLEVVGVWHSHPDHPAHPSETDRSQAWSGWSYLIVAVADGVLVDLRSWRLDGERFFEEEVATWQP